MNNKPKQLSHEELKKLRKPIKNVNAEHKETLTRLEGCRMDYRQGWLNGFLSDNLHMDNPVAWLEHNSIKGITI